TTGSGCVCPQVNEESIYENTAIGRITIANERSGRYTREGATVTATDNDGAMTWFVADIRGDVLVPQACSSKVSKAV
ncbi:MAG: hypothetical protein NTV22_05125, partial [bacterium]|nr:hypothetical protein [bacterium]